MTREQQLADHVAQVLDSGCRELDAATLARLRAVRREAVAVGERRDGGHGVLVWVMQHRWLPLALGSFLLGGWLYYQHQLRQQAAETGELDILLLTEAIPPQAFADFSLVKRDLVEQQCLVAK